MDNIIEVSVSFEKNHPTLEGHFPGNPLIPGVVILNKVLKAAQGAWPEEGGNVSYHVVSCKFLQPLVPPAIMTIHLEKTDNHKIKFMTKLDAIDLSIGIIEIQ